ncbi:MAG: hypothetical protein WDO74_32685 [Pseudomonadota bacterium]
MPPDIVQSRIGTELGRRYRIDAVLVSRPGSTEYSARDLDGRRVSIKLENPGLGSPGSQRTEVPVRRFIEASVWDAVKHPGIVQVYDAGRSDDGLPFIVLEHLSGAWLGDQTFGAELLARWLDQLLDVLAAVHDARSSTVISSRTICSSRLRAG